MFRPTNPTWKVRLPVKQGFFSFLFFFFFFFVALGTVYKHWGGWCKKGTFKILNPCKATNICVKIELTCFFMGLAVIFWQKGMGGGGWNLLRSEMGGGNNFCDNFFFFFFLHQVPLTCVCEAFLMWMRNNDHIFYNARTVTHLWA